MSSEQSRIAVGPSSSARSSSLQSMLTPPGSAHVPSSAELQLQSLASLPTYSWVDGRATGLFEVVRVIQPGATRACKTIGLNSGLHRL